MINSSLLQLVYAIVAVQIIIVYSCLECTAVDIQTYTPQSLYRYSMKQSMQLRQLACATFPAYSIDYYNTACMASHMHADVMCVCTMLAMCIIITIGWL